MSQCVFFVDVARKPNMLTQLTHLGVVASPSPCSKTRQRHQIFANKFQWISWLLLTAEQTMSDGLMFKNCREEGNMNAAPLFLFYEKFQVCSLLKLCQ